MATRSFGPAVLVAIPLIVSVAFCARQLLIEADVAASASGTAPLSKPSEQIGEPRILVYDAAAIADEAMRQPENTPQRAALLREADARIAKALDLRPQWGEAWAVDAHLLAIGGGITSAPAIEAFARSYQVNPFLRDAADWRLRFAVAAWPALSAQTQAAAIREGAILSTVSGELRTHVKVITDGTPLFAQIEARLMQHTGGEV